MTKNKFIYQSVSDANAQYTRNAPLQQFQFSALNRSLKRDLGAKPPPNCSIFRRGSFLKSYQLSFEVHIWTFSLKHIGIEIQ